VLYTTENRALLTQSTFVEVGDSPGTVLELAQPIDDGAARSDLEAVGMDILHAVNFQVHDLGLVRKHLESQGFSLEVDTASLVVTDPITTVGARFGFVEAKIASGPDALSG
jgi:hypothetical protein